MKKSLFSLLVVLVTAFSANAQDIEFNLSYGATFNYIDDGGTGILAPSVTVQPRLNVFAISKNATVSVDAIGGIGADLGGEGDYFILEYGVLGSINLGHMAQQRSNKDFGGYLGLGFGVNKAGGSGDIEDPANVTGLMVSGGTRFYFRDRSVGIGGYTILGGKEKRALGVRLLINLWS